MSKGNHLEPVSHLEKEDWQSWEDRVMEDILEMPNVNAPAGFDQEFEKVIAEALNDREASMMKLRYQDGKTFLEIGEQYNLTKTRVQVIVNNALRKLRNPQYRLWLQYGPNYKSELENLNTVQAEYDRAYLQALEKQQKNDKKASLAIMCKVNDMKQEAEHLSRFATDTYVAETTQKLMEATGIDSLKLSTRSANSLCRHFGKRYITAKDIATLSGQLMDLRGLGTKSAKEIANVMYKKFGIDMLYGVEKTAV